MGGLIGQMKLKRTPLQIDRERSEEETGEPFASNSCTDSSSAGIGAVVLPHYHPYVVIALVAN